MKMLLSANLIIIIETVLTKIDTEEAGSMEPRIVALEHASAPQLAATLTEMFTDPLSKTKQAKTNPEIIPLIMSDDSTNSLIVRARPVDYKLIVAMAQTLDIETTGPYGMKVIPVSRGVDVKALAKEIERTVNSGAIYRNKGSKSTQVPQVAIGANERTPALIVGGSPELFDTVEQLIKDLQQGRVGAGQSVTVIRVRNLEANDVKNILQQVIDQSSGKQR